MSEEGNFKLSKDEVRSSKQSWLEHSIGPRLIYPAIII